MRECVCGRLDAETVHARLVLEPLLLSELFPEFRSAILNFSLRLILKRDLLGELARNFIDELLSEYFVAHELFEL